MRIKILFLLFVLITSPLMASDGNILNDYLNEEYAPLNLSLYFIYNSMAVLSPQEAVDLAAADAVITDHIADLNSSRPITVGELALLLVHNFNLETTLSFQITGAPFFAARSLTLKGWVEGAANRPLRPFQVLELIQNAREAGTARSLTLPAPVDTALQDVQSDTPPPDFPFVDHGAGLDSGHDITFRTASEQLTNANTTTLTYWLDAELAPDYGLLFNLGLQLANPINITDSGRASVLYPLLPTACFYFTPPQIEAKAGIVRLGEYGSPVLFDPALGLDFRFFSRSLTLYGQAGYGGAVFSRSSNIYLNAADTAAQERSGLSLYPFQPDFGVDSLAPPRLLAAVGVDYLLPWGGEISFDVTGQYDARSADSFKALAQDENRVHSQYLTLRYNDSFFGSVYYGIDATAAFLQQNDAPGIAAFGRLNIVWYPDRFINRLLFETGYGSGEDQNLLTYLPISRETLSYVFAPLRGNLLWSETRLTPLAGRHIYLDLSSMFFWRPSRSAGLPNLPVSQLVSPDVFYLGMEFGADFIWRPYPDLSFNLKSGLFLPNPQALDWGMTLKLGLYISFYW